MFQKERVVISGGILGIFQLGTGLKSLSEYALHLTFLLQPGPLPVNKRKGSASYARQRAQLPSSAGRGFLLEQGAGAVPSLRFPPMVLLPASYLSWRVRRGCWSVQLPPPPAGPDGRNRVGARRMLSDLDATPPPGLTRTSGPPPPLESQVAVQPHPRLTVCWKGKGWSLGWTPHS